MAVQTESGQADSQPREQVGGTGIGVTERQGPIRVAIVGCGAVAREFHLPVLAGHEGVRLAALVDRDIGRARAVGREYKVETVLADARELTLDLVDAALVATPPSHHAPCCMDLMQRGIHVFVEKPLAVTTADAVAMVRVADQAGVVLAVGLFRRLLPCVRLLKAVLDKGLLGKPLHFDVEDGAIYGWQAATLGNMRREMAGGGVLIDMGSHTLDRLLFLFPGTAEVIEYRDNSLGGTESDCLLRLRLFHQGQPVEGRVELSRTRNLRNTLRVACERGVFELRPGERYRVWLTPSDGQLVDVLRGQAREYSLQASWHDEPETSWYEPFRVEIDDWLKAIRFGRPPQLSGSSTLPTVQLIESCYRTVRPLEEAWVQEGLHPSVSATGNGELRSESINVAGSAGPLVASGKKAAPPRVLLTGATGFIGCRVAEVLRLRDGWEVRALVHNPGNASRLARLPVEMVMADFNSEQDVSRAVEGCDAVVHCAIGTSWGRRREMFAVTVEGTRKLAKAALAAGVKRFVHLSSIAIHGNDVQGTLDESTPILPPRGDDYAESKAEAERVIARAVRAGLPAVVLRPANVYGPHSRTFITRPIEALAQGRLVLVDSADTPSNTVYVDNVVEAIVRALESKDDVKGETFTISEGDDLTWRDFYGHFAQALGATVPGISSEKAAGLGSKPGGWGLVHWMGSWYRGWADLATSAEMKALAGKFLQTDPLGRLPRHLLERYPGLRRRLRRLLKVDGPVIYNNQETRANNRLEIRPRRALVSIEKAHRLLGYTPSVPRWRAMELTLEWIRYARLIEQ